MKPVHLLVDEDHERVHVSKVRRTDDGNMLIDTSIVTDDPDAAMSDLLTAIDMQRRVVKIDASKAIDACVV